MEKARWAFFRPNAHEPVEWAGEATKSRERCPQPARLLMDQKAP
jgi:hypothetical protein